MISDAGVRHPTVNNLRYLKNKKFNKLTKILILVNQFINYIRKQKNN